MMHPLNKMGPLRDLLGELVKYDDVNRHLIEMVTEIRYPLGGYEEAEDDEAPVMAGHPLLGRPVPPVELTVDGKPVKVAELLCSGHGVLLDLSGNGLLIDTAKPWSDVVDVVVAQPAPEIPAAAVLIRPDGFLAWVAPDTTDDGLTEALRTWFGNRLPADLAGA
jgi:bifunctional hydroxylase/dehydrase